MKPLTRSEAYRQALHYAILERTAYAEAYGNKGPEAERALHQAAEFTRHLKERFGQQTFEARLTQAMMNDKSVNLFEAAVAPTREFEDPFLKGIRERSVKPDITR